MEKFSPTLEKIARSLKLARVKSGMKQSELAALLNINESLVNEMEKTGNVRVTMFADICQVLNLDPATLMKITN